MKKFLVARVLLILVLLGINGCSMQHKSINNIESNLKEINKGFEQFSELKNGTLQVNTSVKSANNAVEAMEQTKNTTILTFTLNSKGYEFIEKTTVLNEKTGQIQHSATKQIQGKLFLGEPFEQSTKDKVKSYEWHDISEGKRQYEPNGALKMMTSLAKWLSNKEYIEAITKEKDGLLTKYTVTTNDAFAKYARESHRSQENYTVIEHREIYWIDNNGLLVKHQMYDEIEWTIDGVADTYTLYTTVELTGSNDKDLKEIGDNI